MGFGDGVFNVFVIGPMGVLEKERSGRSFWQRLLETASGGGRAAVFENTVAVKRALEALLSEPEAQTRLARVANGGWRADIPDEQLGNAILRDVFSKIDNADLIVADLHWNRPSVYYELALAHALHVPAILIAKAGETPAFYFQENKIRYVADYSVEALRAALREPLLKFLDGEADLHANPISEFYQAPLLHVSAATGLAVGYYVNLVLDVLFRNGGGLEQLGLEKLYVVRLEDILDRGGDEKRLCKLLETVIGQQHEKLASYNRTFKRPTSGGRDAFVTVCGNAVIDLPTTLYTLLRAPRYQRLQATLRGAGGPSAPTLKRMRTSMIAAFYDALKLQVERDDLVSQNRLEMLTFDELEKRLRRG